MCQQHANDSIHVWKQSGWEAWSPHVTILSYMHCGLRAASPLGDLLPRRTRSHWAGWAGERGPVSDGEVALDRRERVMTRASALTVMFQPQPRVLQKSRQPGSVTLVQ